MAELRKIDTTWYNFKPIRKTYYKIIYQIKPLGVH